MTETLDRQLVNLSAGAHVCPIYATAEERMEVLMPFLCAGMARGEQCIYIADAASGEAVVRALRAAGIDSQAEIDRGALVLLVDRAAYVSNGRFDPQAMYTLLRGMAERARASGFAGLTLAGEMTWIAGPEFAEARFLQCEARLNELPPELGTKIMCQYDRHQFPPPILRDVLRVHPQAIVGGHVHQNIYFDPWALAAADERYEVARIDAMLEQLQTRTRRQTAVADLGRLSLANTPPGDLLTAAMELITAELQVEFAEVLALGRSTDSVYLVAGAGWRQFAAGPQTDIEIDPVARNVLATGRPVIVPDWRVEIRFRQPPLLRSAGIFSSLQVGIRSRADDRLEGILGVHSSNQRIFSEDEVAFLDTIAIQLAHACRVRRAEEEFRVLADNTSDVIARLDRAMCHVYVNAAIEPVLGVAAESLIGKTIHEIGVPESLARAWELVFLRTWQTGREHTTEFSLTTPSGERSFRSRIVPELTSDGAVEFVLAISQDVTEQRRAEIDRTQRELRRAADDVQLERLTVQERNVLQFVAQGWTNREISARLGRTPGTVKNYIAAILSKLDVSDRTQAAVRAVELGLVGRETDLPA